MTITIERPKGTPATKAKGSLGFDQFQTAYVTNDFDRAIQVFRDRYGMDKWTVMEPGSGMKIGIAWTGGQQIELIDASDTVLSIYNDWLTGKGFQIRHHHFGYYVYSKEEWDRVEQVLANEGREAVFEGDGGIVQFKYVFAQELGHYLEYIFPNENGKAFFEAAASN